MDIRAALKIGIARLRDANVPSFTLAAELLLLHVLQCDRSYLYAHPEEQLTRETLEDFFSLIERRAAGEPMQHLTGSQEFWGLNFIVSPDVLIPRPETEHLIEVALDRLALRQLHAGRPQKTTGENFMFADIGTGSGCIAITLAKEFPAAQVFAVDISAAALAVAQQNAERHLVNGRIHFLAQDFSALLTKPNAPTEALRPATFDLVISNPPYISRRDAPTLAREVRDHEPAIALYGGEEGYELYPDLILLATSLLKPGGFFVAELGHETLPAVQPLLESPHWTSVGVTNDLAGIPRVIAAERTLAPNSTTAK